VHDVDAPYFIARSLILSADSLDDVTITDIEVWNIDLLLPALMIVCFATNMCKQWAMTASESPMDIGA